MNGAAEPDKLAIVELLYRYALAVDTDDFGKMKDIFTEDATFRLLGMEAGEWHWTVKEYCEFVSTIVKQCDWVMHNTTNVIVDLAGDTASAASYLATTYGVKAGENVLAFQLHGNVPVDVELGARYRDRLVRTDEGWRIAERTCEVLYQRERVVERIAGTGTA